MFPFSDIELKIGGKKNEKKDMYTECIDYIASISEKYKVMVKARRGNYDKDFIREDFVAKTVSISFKFDGKEICFSGIVSEFNSNVSFKEGVLYEYFYIIFEPDFLGKDTRRNKVYLKKSTVDIVKYLVENNTKLKLSSKAKGGTAPREFAFQYQSESDEEFCNRILSEEGIYYSFDQKQESIILYDDTNYTESGVVIKVGPEIECSKFNTYQIKKYTVYDHNFESPATDLVVEKENSDKSCFLKSSVGIWIYPGAANKSTGDGENAITKLLNRQKMKSTEYEFEFTNIFRCVKLDVCSKFKLRDLNKKTEKEYAVTYIHIHLPNNGKDVKFNVKAIEANIAYVPEVITPPAIPLLPAVVIGQENTQRNYKNYSVQVKFYWQTEKEKEDLNYWLRVAQLWAGKDYGTFFRPVIGSEVIISFLYGPNRAPVVIGCLHDAQVKYPYEDKKFCSGIITKNEEGKYPTELIFDDSKDKEKFSINTAKDYESKIQNHRTISLVEGNDQLKIEKGNRSVQVEKGNEEIAVKQGNRTIKAPSGEHSISSKTQIIDASQTIEIKANQGITIKCGGAQIKLSPEGVEIQAPTVKINGTGQVEINGAMTKVQGSGMLQCQGGIVKIN